MNNRGEPSNDCEAWKVWFEYTTLQIQALACFPMPTKPNSMGSSLQSFPLSGAFSNPHPFDRVERFGDICNLAWFLRIIVMWKGSAFFVIFVIYFCIVLCDEMTVWHYYSLPKPRFFILKSKGISGFDYSICIWFWEPFASWVLFFIVLYQVARGKNKKKNV